MKHRSILTPINWILICGLLLAGTVAAVDLSIPSMDGAAFDIIAVPVIVSDFTDVAGVQISILYDNVNLSIDSIMVNLALAGPTTNTAVSGEIFLLWDDFSTPVSLTDNDTLMMMYFTVPGSASGMANIWFATAGLFKTEFTDTAANVLPLTTSGGQINIQPTDADDDTDLLPGVFELKQNYPNPFNPSTTIAFSVAKTARLVFEVYNVGGQVIDRIDLGVKSPGEYAFVYEAESLASGVYYYRLTSENASESRRMILLK